MLDAAVREGKGVIKGVKNYNLIKKDVLAVLSHQGLQVLDDSDDFSKKSLLDLGIVAGSVVLTRPGTCSVVGDFIEEMEVNSDHAVFLH